MLKTTHILLALISISGFLLRGLIVTSGRTLPRNPWTRVAPHLVDTLLLASGIGLMASTAQYPDQHPWLAYKLGLLLAYIGLGFVVLRFARSTPQRVGALILALLCFGTMAWLATTRLQ